MPEIKVEGRSIRPDIFIWVPSKEDVKIVVECGGYSFHSDKPSFIRDRKLQSKGHQVLRYSGSEICKNPATVGYDLAGYLLSLAGIIQIID